MDLIDTLRHTTLDSFITAHPEIKEAMDAHVPPMPERIKDPMALVAAESAYNERAMSYVCALGGEIGQKAPYPHKFVVQSQVMAAFGVQEGGLPRNHYLDPHSCLREFMMETVSRLTGCAAPELPFARKACLGMGEVYGWYGDVPEVSDRYAAMLGAHFASEYLAAQQEFPSMCRLFQRDQAELFDAMRAEKEPHFGFSAADWLEGHPAVELKHAGFAACAAEAAVWEMEDPSGFWQSFRIGFEAFCANDEAYFRNLTEAQSRA